MECLYGFASSISRDLVCGALNQLRYPCCFNNFIEELEKEEGNFVATRASVQKFVEHAHKQTRKTSEVVDKWLQDSNTDIENVNKLLKEARRKNSCCFGRCPNWIWRYHLGKKLTKKIEDLKKFIEEGKNYAPLDRIATLPSNTFHILTEECMNFKSRKHVSDQLMEALKDDRVAMIGLYGMGGCGKTTLAKEIKMIVEDEHLFGKVIFVTVSGRVEVGKIQEKIVSSLQYTFPENEEMERAQRLCMRLTQENKILIILDDVWDKLDFGCIGIPSFEHHKGCKILVTTRSEDVCILMDCQKKIYLPILTDEEAWTLFQNKALMSEDTPENLKHLAILISNECKGLPVAIVAVASSLKGKEEVIWRNALNKLKSSRPINIGRGLPDPYKCLQLSYDNLDTKEAKALFLLCSVFPEDCEIPMECLIRCAIGLGVVGEVDTYEEARTEVIATIIKLESSCLMMKANDECVKMHDLVRDVAHWIAKNENKMIKCEVEKDVSLEQGSIRYLWCVKFPDDIDCSNLEFLSIQTKLEVSDEIFERMGKLRVLIITNKNFYRLELSTSFKSLTNLRCLILQYFALRDISFVRDMKKLQSLSFHRCSWPSFLDLQTDVEVTTLTNLKLLEFKSCDIESNIFEEIKRIPFLEELYIYKRGYNKEDIVKFFNSFSVPQTLQRYGIILDYSTFYSNNRFRDFCSCERTLGINYFDISNEVIMGLAEKAKELFVANIEGGAKNMMPDIFRIEEGMNELKELTIRDCEGIMCLVDTSNHLSKVGNLFSTLRLMRIFNMKHLKTLWHGCPPVNRCFEKLEKLHIKDCHELICLFTYVIAQRVTEKSEDQFTNGHSMQSKIFQNLQQLKLEKCRELKHVFSASITGDLCQLKILQIKDCNMLEQIIEDVLPAAHHEETNESIINNSSGSFSLSSLQNLEIESCPMLDSLFTTSVAKTLTSLEELKISECHGLKHIVTLARLKRNKKENMVEDEHEFESNLSMFSSLKRITICWCNSLQDIFTTPVNGCFEKLEKLEIFLCPQLTYLFTYVIAQGLTELKILHIYNCDILKHIIVDDDKIKKSTVEHSEHSEQSRIFQNLKELRVYGCQELKYVFSASIIGGLPQLEMLDIATCNVLEQIIEDVVPRAHHEETNEIVEEDLQSSSGSFSLSSLKFLEIHSCPMLSSLFTTSVIKTLTLLEELTIFECHGLKQSDFLMFSSLKRIVIRKCASLQDIFATPVNYECFEKLEKVYIEDCPQLTYLFTYVIAQGLTELKILHISNCDILNHIITDDDKTKKSEDQFTIEHSRIFQNLQEVNISKCGELKHVFSANMTGGLPQLKKLEIENCNMLEQIIVEEDEYQHFESNQVKVYAKSISIPSLSIVNNSSESFSLSSLAVLRISSCSMLGSLFTISVAKTLTSLEELNISDCHGLKHIVTFERVKVNINIVEDEHEFESDLSMFSSLKRVKISRCDSLKDIFVMPFVGGRVNIHNHFPTHQTLHMNNANDGDSMMGQQVNFKLEYLWLENLPEMTHIWVATNNSFTLQHLNSLLINKCEKLEVIFPQSMLTCLPELDHLEVIQCKELRRIIEGDLEDKRLSNILSLQPCFAKLERLAIQECHKLKCFTSLFASNDLSNLKILIIRGASELQEFIACEYDETGKTKVELPQLKLIIFMHLSNFQQETIFLNVKHRIVHNCPKLSLTSTITPRDLKQNLPLEGLENSRISDEQILSLMYEIEKLDEVSRSNNSTELPSSQIKEESDKKFIEKDHGSKEVAPATSINSEVDTKSNCETYSQELVDAKSTTESHFTDQQNQFGQTQSTIKMSQELDPTPKNTSPLQMNREDPSTSQIKPCSSQVNDNNQSMLEIRVEMVGQHNEIETKTLESEIKEFQKIDRKSEMASDPQAMEQDFPVISSPNMIERTDEIETDNLGKTTSDKPAIPTFVSENSEEIGRERSRDGPTTEGATIKTLSIGGDNISLVSGVTIHNSSTANMLSHDSHVVKQDNEMNEDKTEIAPYKNIKIQERVNLLDKAEEIGIVSNNDVVVTPASTDTRTRLEKYKQFVDLNDSQISLLVEAIEAYPHLWNACEKFTDGFRAFMLKTLANMLLFLRSESVATVNPEREKVFLKLCDEVVQLGFEKSWVDKMRQRVVERDPKLDHARAQMDELLNRHDHLTEELDSIKGELLKRHDHITQELHNMNKQLRSLNDLFGSPTKCFDFL